MRLSFTALVFAALLPASLAGKCKNPEIRKEWRRFSRAEQAEWIRAVNCLNKKPASGKLVPPVDLSKYEYYDQIVPVTKDSSYQDELTYVHMNLNPIIHNTGLFLPWHRWYLQSWTDALRTQCGYKGVTPYWAWEFDTGNFEKSSIFNADKTSGLGTWGDANDDYTVKDGGFWNMTFAYPTRHHLRRKYVPFPYMAPAGVDPSLYPYDTFKGANLTFTLGEVLKLLAQPTGDFKKFQYYMEQAQSMHTSVHMILGGDLGGLCPANATPAECPFSGAPTISPNEPMFFLHHGNIDRLWWLWQKLNAKNQAAFAGGSVRVSIRSGKCLPNSVFQECSTLLPSEMSLIPLGILCATFTFRVLYGILQLNSSICLGYFVVVYTMLI
ncbi:tyrosinase tyrosinase: common central domain protein [Rhizoctonia solani AG-3 Rhs1AP]|uniref:Tyrosinase tyrosinase: common central domain protein n=1 Tax=Rhizoctonia solani AG-3 Rhs1AP TaxID=1086054 RepID=X8J9Q9_9AGAM|nr:tyrosinase tyrosinase: common central domain protein [Rhizoctonia solani AG-3 Rhs1AP]